MQNFQKLILSFLLLFVMGCGHADEEISALEKEVDESSITGVIAGFDTALVSGNTFKTSFIDIDSATKTTKNFYFATDGVLKATFVASHFLLLRDITCDLDGSWKISAVDGFIETEGFLTCDDPDKNDVFNRRYALLETLDEKKKLHLRQYDISGKQVELTIERVNIVDEIVDEVVDTNNSDEIIAFDSALVSDKIFRASYEEKNGDIFQTDDFHFKVDGNIEATSFTKEKNSSSVAHTCIVTGHWDTANALGHLVITTHLDCNNSAKSKSVEIAYTLFSRTKNGLVLDEVADETHQPVIFYEKEHISFEDKRDENLSETNTTQETTALFDTSLILDKTFQMSLKEGSVITLTQTTKNLIFLEDGTMSADIEVEEFLFSDKCVINNGRWSVDNSDGELIMSGVVECESWVLWDKEFRRSYTLIETTEEVLILDQKDQEGTVVRVEMREERQEEG